MRTTIEELCVRHTLVTITREGRERILEEIAALGYDKKICGELLLPEKYPSRDLQRCPGCVGQPPIPGIVRREDFSPRKGYIAVGFASWRSSETGRLRIPSFVHPDEIESIWPPESAISRAARINRKDLRQTPAMRAVVKLLDLRGAVPAAMGLWGTVALEVQTGYPYTHEHSDLDLLLAMTRPAGRTELRRCLSVVLALEKEFAIRVDAEVSLSNGYGVSLRELLQGGAAVLAKGQQNVALMSKEEVLAGLGKPAEQGI